MKKVLIVEDDKDFLWLLRQSFDAVKDLAVVFATDGEEGLAAAQRENPDLILIDIMLPKMDGIAMARKIKESGMNSQMVFLTNLRDPQHISEVMNVAVGADYIVKSDVHIDAIVERVKSKLGI